MTIEVIHHVIQDLRLLNVSIHRNFHNKQFINECAKIRSFRFFVRYKRTILKLFKVYIIKETLNKNKPANLTISNDHALMMKPNLPPLVHQCYCNFKFLFHSGEKEGGRKRVTLK